MISREKERPHTPRHLDAAGGRRFLYNPQPDRFDDLARDGRRGLSQVDELVTALRDGMGVR